MENITIEKMEIKRFNALLMDDCRYVVYGSINVGDILS